MQHSTINTNTTDRKHLSVLRNLTRIGLETKQIEKQSYQTSIKRHGVYKRFCKIMPVCHRTRLNKCDVSKWLERMM